jgi:hypothetical protein
MELLSLWLLMAQKLLSFYSLQKDWSGKRQTDLHRIERRRTSSEVPTSGGN